MCTIYTRERSESLLIRIRRPCFSLTVSFGRASSSNTFWSPLALSITSLLGGKFGKERGGGGGAPFRRLLLLHLIFTTTTTTPLSHLEWRRKIAPKVDKSVRKVTAVAVRTSCRCQTQTFPDATLYTIFSLSNWRCQIFSGVVKKEAQIFFLISLICIPTSSRWFFPLSRPLLVWRRKFIASLRLRAVH